MTNNARVTNISRRFTLKHKQALRAVEQCACAWVEYGVSIRDLTLAESIAARNKQAADSEPLALSELKGVVYRPALRDCAQYAQGRRLAYQADRFAFDGVFI